MQFFFFSSELDPHMGCDLCNTHVVVEISMFFFIFIANFIQFVSLFQTTEKEYSDIRLRLTFRLNTNSMQTKFIYDLSQQESKLNRKYVFQFCKETTFPVSFVIKS